MTDPCFYNSGFLSRKIIHTIGPRSNCDILLSTEKKKRCSVSQKITVPKKHEADPGGLDPKDTIY